jgi:hypothetical protein
MLGELKNPENVLVKVISISFLSIRKKEEEKVSSFFCQNRFFVFVLRTKKIFVRDAAETFADDEK